MGMKRRIWTESGLGFGGGGSGLFQRFSIFSGQLVLKCAEIFIRRWESA